MSILKKNEAFQKSAWVCAEFLRKIFKKLLTFAVFRSILILI